MEQYFISSDFLSLENLLEIITSDVKLRLSESSKKKIINCRDYLNDKIDNHVDPIYGINTGFGSLYNIKIAGDNLQQLQENLVMSHACGSGEEVPQEIVRIMLFLKIQSLSYGYSGVQIDTIERLINFYNNEIFPVVYTQGSLGASGDLAPLAHLSLPLIGLGEVNYKGDRISGEELLKRFSWDKISLQSKEGLSLLNGTQFMSAYGVYLLIKSYKLSYIADVVGALSLEGFDGRIEPFNYLIHHIRPHDGQIKTAQRISDFLEGSELISQDKEHVQDPYSFRCMPQVHGATKDALAYITKTILTEINSVTDNPNVFTDEDIIVSGGNFHGQPLALVLDYLSIVMAELGNISERRTYQLISGLRGLPAFLVSNPGLNSGFMIPQYTAASIVSANKQFCTPSSVDSIVSSNGQEDHVSMGANAAVKAKKVIDNVHTILSIELMNASQALSFRKASSSEFLESFVKMFRKDVPVVSVDRVLYTDIKSAQRFIESISIDINELF